MPERTIWVDADACPGVIKNILFKAMDRLRADRSPTGQTRVALTLVANHPMTFPRRTYVRFLQVSSGMDAADQKILELMGSGDLVITADIPLAEQVLTKEGWALNPRGHLYSVESIQEQLRMRAFKEELRDSGINTGGPPAVTQQHRNQFAAHLNRWVSRV